MNKRCKKRGSGFKSLLAVLLVFTVLCGFILPAFIVNATAEEIETAETTAVESPIADDLEQIATLKAQAEALDPDAEDFEAQCQSISNQLTAIADAANTDLQNGVITEEQHTQVSDAVGEVKATLDAKSSPSEPPAPEEPTDTTDPIADDLEQIAALKTQAEALDPAADDFETQCQTISSQLTAIADAANTDLQNGVITEEQHTQVSDAVGEVKAILNAKSSPSEPPASDGPTDTTNPIADDLEQIAALKAQAEALDPDAEDIQSQCMEIYNGLAAVGNAAKADLQSGLIEDGQYLQVSNAINDTMYILLYYGFDPYAPVTIPDEPTSLNIRVVNFAGQEIYQPIVYNGGEVTLSSLTTDLFTEGACIIDGYVSYYKARVGNGTVLYQDSVDVYRVRYDNDSGKWQYSTSENGDNWEDLGNKTISLVFQTEQQKKVVDLFGSRVQVAILGYLAGEGKYSIPGEPSLRGANGYGFLSSGYAVGDGNTDFSTSNNGIIDPDILFDPNFHFTSFDGSDTVGLTGASLTVIKSYISGVYFDGDDMRNAVIGKFRATDGKWIDDIETNDGDTNGGIDDYKIVPYVIKLQNDVKWGWHIDCAIVPIESVTLTYNPNIPYDLPLASGYTLAVPNAQTDVKDDNGTATFSVLDMYLRDGDNQETRTVCLTSGEGKTLYYEFLGWSTDPDATTAEYYYTDPDATTAEYYYTDLDETSAEYKYNKDITIREDTVLYAVWRTQRLTITKQFDGLPDDVKKPSVSFNITGPDGYSNSVTLDGYADPVETKAWTATILGVEQGSYTVTEATPDDDAVDDYTCKQISWRVGESTDTGNSAEFDLGPSGADVVFTNTYKSKTTSVTVTKEWKDTGGDPLAEKYQPDSVTVKLQRCSDNGSTWGDVDDGQVTLYKNDTWSHTYTELLVEDDKGNPYTYRVIEVGVESNRITLDGNDYTVSYGELTTDDDGSSYKQTITNTLIPKVRLEITKKSASTQETLNGATFKLEKDSGSGWTEVGTATSGVDNISGWLYFANLEPGTYRLTETKAADGYSLLAKPITIEITKNPDGSYAATVDDASTYLTADGVNYKLQLTVYNKPILAMPATGGVNGFEFWILGGLCIMAVPLLLYTLFGCKKGGKYPRK